jgi:hypothetical protein
MRPFILSLAVVAAAACQPVTTELTEAQKTEIAAHITALNSEYWDAWRAADWDRGMGYYVNSPDFIWAAGGVVYLGYAALDATRPQFGYVANQTFTFGDTRVAVLSADAATVTALGTWSQTDTAGVTGPERDFAWTALWALHDGEWKMQLVHMSYAVRAREPR